MSRLMPCLRMVVHTFCYWFVRYKNFFILRRLQRKRRPVNVIFLVHESAKWACQSLYEKMAADERFHVQVVVEPCHVQLINYREFCENKRTRQMYYDTLRFFQERKMNVCGAVDSEKKTFRRISEFSPDILFLQELVHFRRSFIFSKFLMIYIPYSIATTNNYAYGYRKLMHSMLWRYFVETPVHKQIAVKYGTVKGRNVIVAGYPKLDTFYIDSPVDDSCWKTKPPVKRLIYAPHFTILPRPGLFYWSTFLTYSSALLEYARKHPEIEMILKPHPLLKSALQKVWVAAHFNSYFAAWDALPNGSVVEGGNYFDMFKSSDAMILDSSSFICEYAYTKKPMLFLCREPDILEKDSNEFGIESTQHLYRAHSFADIESFIQDKVMNGNDPLYERRDYFVEKIMKQNQRPAADFIVEHIKEALSR
jgi:hypothetical protein